MKKLLFSISIFFALCAFAPQDAQAQRFFEEVSDVDSLVNQDTVILNFAYTFKRPFYYSIQIQADSISGANAGTAYLQFSNDKATSGTKWHTAQTMTIDGTGSDYALYEGILYARRARLYFISPSGTRRVNLYTFASFKQLP